MSCLAAHLVTRRPRPPYAEALPAPPPAAPDARIQGLELTAADGVTVHGWAILVAEGAPTALLLHMNRADRGAMVPAARVWAELGWNTVAVSLRSHGDAEGGRLDFGRTARLDAAAAARWARARLKAPLVVHGVSLGAAAAVFAAAEGSLDADGYVLEAPYTRLADAARDRTALYLPAPLDRIAAWSLARVTPWFVPGAEGIAPLEAARALPRRAPVLVLHGEQDRRAPPPRIALFRDAFGPRATFRAAPLGHAEWLHHPELLHATLAAWLEATSLAPR